MYYLGIDVGTRYLGLAIGNIHDKISTPLSTIKFNSNNFIQAVNILKTRVNNWGYQIKKCVVGWPLHEDGSWSRATHMVQQFCEELQKQTNWEIELHDERYTTKIAKALLSDMGLKGSVRDKNVDRVSASVILQSYFENEQR